MPSGLLNLALGVAMQVGSPGPSETPGYPAPANAFSRTGVEASSEQRYPFDTQQKWVHGYFQEIPAYGGHPVFRPYNYKDVLSQSQTAAGWGERPGMPYSQQFWHKYHDQATMLKSTQMVPQSAPQPTAPVWTPAPSNRQMPGYAGWSVAPGSQIMIPPSAPISSGPLHVPPTNFTPAGLPENPQNQGLQPAVDVVTPIGFRR
jgi:hypothetical protein